MLNEIQYFHFRRMKTDRKMKKSALRISLISLRTQSTSYIFETSLSTNSTQTCVLLFHRFFNTPIEGGRIGQPILIRRVAKRAWLLYIVVSSVAGVSVCCLLHQGLDASSLSNPGRAQARAAIPLSTPLSPRRFRLCHQDARKDHSLMRASRGQSAPHSKNNVKLRELIF